MGTVGAIYRGIFKDHGKFVELCDWLLKIPDAQADLWEFEGRRPTIKTWKNVSVPPNCYLNSRPAKNETEYLATMRLAGPIGSRNPDTILRSNAETLKQPIPLTDGRLDGICLELYDWRSPLFENRYLWFVRLSEASDSRANGLLVECNETDGFGLEPVDTKKSENGHLILWDTPEIELRYAFEEAFDFLFGWIKIHYCPNLFYWRYKDFPGFEVVKRQDEQFGKEALFDEILSLYRADDEWWNKASPRKKKKW